MNDSQFIVRFVGNDLKPNSIAASELVEMITAVEFILVEKAIEIDKDLTKEDLVISIVSISDKSLGIVFQPQKQSVINPAFTAFSEDVNKKDFSSYKGKRKEYLRKIVQFSKLYNCEAQLIQGDLSNEVLAIITPEIEVSSPSLISGATTVYGRVVSVGGKSPNVHVDTPSGKTVICDVSIDQARDLAGRLYDWVGLVGKARWDSDEFDLRDFIVDRIIDYSPGSASEGINEIKQIAGNYFSDVTDVNTFIDEVRNGEEEG